MFFRKDHPGLFLLLLCYVGGLIVLLCVHLFGLVANRVAYANGSLATTQLALADFELADMTERDGVLTTTGGDPQLVLQDKTLRVDTLRFVCVYAQAPGEVNVFWTDAAGVYSTRRMAFSTAADSTLFLLQPTGVTGLRIDPGTLPGNEIRVLEITANQPRPAWRFFVPSPGQAILLLVLPGLLACGLWLLGWLLPKEKAARLPWLPKASKEVPRLG